MGWQKASGYNWRALVEADIGRWKRVIGHALRSQTDERQRGDGTNAAEELPGSRMLRCEEGVGRRVDERPILRHHAPYRYCAANRPGTHALFRYHTAVRCTVSVVYVA